MRSLLFIPADSDKKLAKAMACGADAVILDLEDAIAPDRKAIAREMAQSFMAANRASTSTTRPALYVRINGLDTPYWQDDIAGLAAVLPDGIMLPKTTSGEHVHQLSVVLDHQEEKAGVGNGTTRILPLITETAISLLQLQTYVGASTRLAAFTWGAEDLSAELGSRSNRDIDGAFTSPYRLARDLTLITAAAAGIAAIDTVYVDFRNAAGLTLEASMAARDGFIGKLAIHPDQVAIINEAFTPSAAEVARAAAIVAAFDASPGTGVVGFEGQMLDRPHRVKAERTLARCGPSRRMTRRGLYRCRLGPATSSTLHPRPSMALHRHRHQLWSCYSRSRSQHGARSAAASPPAASSGRAGSPS